MPEFLTYPELSVLAALSSSDIISVWDTANTITKQMTVGNFLTGSTDLIETYVKADGTRDMSGTTDWTISTTAQSVLSLHRDTNTDDQSIDLLFQADDSNDDVASYGKIAAIIDSSTDGAHDGQIRLYAVKNTAYLEIMRVTQSGLFINEGGSIAVDVRMEGDNDQNLYFLSATNDAITIGSQTELGKLGVDGNADEIQLVVQGNATQTSDIFEVQKSDGTQCFAVGADKIGFYATAPIALQTGVAATEAAIHAALVALGLITA